MNRILVILFFCPVLVSGQISFRKDHVTSIYAQEVSKPYELSNGNFICSVQHGQNNVWFNVLYLFSECGELLSTLHVSTPAEYMFFSNFVQISEYSMVASGFVYDSVYHTIYLTLDINTLEVLNERRNFEGNWHRVSRSFTEDGKIYQLGGPEYGNIMVSTCMNFNLVRNLHVYKIFEDLEYPDLRDCTPTVFSKNRIYSLEDYTDSEHHSYSVVRCLDGKLRDVYTIENDSDSMNTTMEGLVCLGLDTLLIGATEREKIGDGYQKYIRRYERDMLVYERPVEGFGNFFDYGVCSFVDGKVKCVEYDGRVAEFDENGEEIFSSGHLVPLLQEGDMSRAIMTRDGGILSVADNYVQVDGVWEEVLTVIKINSDYQITPKPDPKCIVATEEIVMDPGVAIFPNPTSGTIRIASRFRVIGYKIYDSASSLILSGSADANEFDIEFNLLPGIYAIHIETDRGLHIHKLFVTD